MGRCSFDNRFTLTLLGEPTALASHPRRTPKRTCSIDPPRDLCVTADNACGAIQITLRPSPRSYFDGLSTSGPGPSDTGYAKASSRERGLDLPSAPWRGFGVVDRGWGGGYTPSTGPDRYGYVRGRCPIYHLHDRRLGDAFRWMTSRERRVGSSGFTLPERMYPE